MENRHNFNPYEAPQVTEISSLAKPRRPVLQVLFFSINFGIAMIAILVMIAVVVFERERRDYLGSVFGAAIGLAVFVPYAVTEVRVFIKRSEGQSSIGVWNIVCGLGLFISAMLAGFIELKEQPNQPFWSRFALYGPLMISSVYAIGCGCYRVTRFKRNSGSAYDRASENIS